MLYNTSRKTVMGTFMELIFEFQHMNKDSILVHFETTAGQNWNPGKLQDRF